MYTITYTLTGFATVQRSRRRHPVRCDRDAQHRTARRRGGGDDHRDGRDARRGHPEQHARAEGPRRPAHLGAAGDSRLRQPAGHGARHSGDGACEHRYRAGDELLHLTRRPEQRRHDPDRRHERRVGVQRGRRVELRLRHVELRRSPDHDCGRPGRDRSRRATVQPRPEDGRQHLQRHLLRQHRRQVVAGQQPRRHAALVRDRRSRHAVQELGHELRLRRTDHEGQAVVLRRDADPRRVYRHRELLCQRQRRRRDEVELRRRPQHPGAKRQQPEGPRFTVHAPGHAPQQVQLLLRLPEGLPGRRVHEGQRRVPQPRRRLGRRRRVRHAGRPRRPTCGTIARRSRRPPGRRR